MAFNFFDPLGRNFRGCGYMGDCVQSYGKAVNDMRLINANKAISRVDEIPLLADKNQAFFEGCRYMKKRVLKVLRTSKTIDAVEVVRCKDCKHYDKRSDCCEVIGFSCLPDNFCSYGERKDGEG